MPTYCYKCECGVKKTVHQKMNDLKPVCEKQKDCNLERDYRAEGGASAVFKGTGFHSTDYDTKEGQGR